MGGNSIKGTVDWGVKELRVTKIRGVHAVQSRAGVGPQPFPTTPGSLTAVPSGQSQVLLSCTYQVAAQAFGRSCSQHAPSWEGLARSGPGPAEENRGQL